MVNLRQLKMDYNFNLNRFYNGCNYCEEHPEDVDKYYDELKKIYNKAFVEILSEIEKYEKPTSKELLEGFEIK